LAYPVTLLQLLVISGQLGEAEGLVAWYAAWQVAAADVDKLKKRKLVSPTSEKYHKLGKGLKFALQKAKLVTDLTQEMIVKGTWKSQTFKEYNFNALGQPPAGGHLHPLLKVR